MIIDMFLNVIICVGVALLALWLLRFMYYFLLGAGMIYGAWDQARRRRRQS